MFRWTSKSRNLRNFLVQKEQASTFTADCAVQNENVLPFSKIPKIPTLPYIGSGWIYYPLIGKYDLTRLHTASIHKYHKYGPIYREAFSSDFQVVNIHDPEDIAKMFRNEGRFPERRTLETIKKYREDKKDLYSNGGLLTTVGPEWWEVRRQVQPNMMKPKAIYSYIGSMDEVSTAFIDRMAHLRGKDGGEVPDYLNELYKWALESVALVAFDARLGCIDLNPNEEAVKTIKAVNTLFEQMIKMEFGSLNLWKKFPTPAYRKFEKCMDYVSRKSFGFLQEALKRLETMPEDHEVSFLEKMISTTKDPRNINAMMTDMVFAGIDTTSSALAFVLYHLARNPKYQETLYQEIKSTVKGFPLSKEVLNSMSYMKACVKESMRLNPVAIGNVRKAAEDTVLSGYAVPAGTHIFAQHYAIGRMEKYFPAANQFQPERFLRGTLDHDPFGYLPFGFGTRSCIGRRIAEQEIWILLTRIIERFRVEYNYEDMDMVIRGVATPDKPLKFQFYDR